MVAADLAAAPTPFPATSTDTCPAHVDVGVTRDVGVTQANASTCATAAAHRAPQLLCSRDGAKSARRDPHGTMIRNHLQSRARSAVEHSERLRPPVPNWTHQCRYPASFVEAPRTRPYNMLMHHTHIHTQRA